MSKMSHNCIWLSYDYLQFITMFYRNLVCVFIRVCVCVYKCVCVCVLPLLSTAWVQSLTKRGTEFFSLSHRISRLQPNTWSAHTHTHTRTQ